MSDKKYYHQRIEVQRGTLGKHEAKYFEEFVDDYLHAGAELIKEFDYNPLAKTSEGESE